MDGWRVGWVRSWFGSGLSHGPAERKHEQTKMFGRDPSQKKKVVGDHAGCERSSRSRVKWSYERAKTSIDDGKRNLAGNNPRHDHSPYFSTSCSPLSTSASPLPSASLKLDLPEPPIDLATAELVEGVTSPRLVSTAPPRSNRSELIAIGASVKESICGETRSAIRMLRGEVPE